METTTFPAPDKRDVLVWEDPARPGRFLDAWNGLHDRLTDALRGACLGRPRTLTYSTVRFFG
jgi:hypothetical protein